MAKMTPGPSCAGTGTMLVQEAVCRADANAYK